MVHPRDAFPCLHVLAGVIELSKTVARHRPKAELINQAAFLTIEVFFLGLWMQTVLHVYRISQARLLSKTSVLRSLSWG